MTFEKFSMVLIVPFEYKVENYTKLCLGQLLDILENFQPEKLSLDMLDNVRAELFRGNEHSILKCYSLKNDAETRKRVGLCKVDHLYSMTKRGNNYSFKVKEIKTWLFDSGKAYFSIVIETEGIEEAHILELKNILTDIKVKCPIMNSFSEENIFTINSLIADLIGLSSTIEAKISANETFDKAYTLTYALADTLEEEKIDELTELICMNRTSSMKTCVSEKNACRHFKKYEYIVWMMSKKSLAIIGDCEKAGANLGFLKDGLKGSVLRRYLLMYLYYLNLNYECKNIKNYCDQVKQNKRKNLEDTMIQKLSSIDYYMQPMMKESYQHLDFLFLDCLCDKTWGLRDEVKLLHKDYLKWAIEYQEYDIFISYRREGGFYLARLLQELLSKRKVFLDVERLKSGKFDEALEKAILQCRNVIVILSPGSLERCNDPEDYVRKEIALAIKEGKNIIPVMMEGFQLPETMPDGLEEFPLHNGIFCAPHIFRDYTMKNIIDYLK